MISRKTVMQFSLSDAQHESLEIKKQSRVVETNTRSVEGSMYYFS